MDQRMPALGKQNPAAAQQQRSADSVTPALP